RIERHSAVCPALYADLVRGDRLDDAGLPAGARQRVVLVIHELVRRVLIDEPDDRVPFVQRLAGPDLRLEPHREVLYLAAPVVPLAIVLEDRGRAVQLASDEVADGEPHALPHAVIVRRVAVRATPHEHRPTWPAHATFVVEIRRRSIAVETGSTGV